MKKTYLLQRGRFLDRRDLKKGIDSIISLDYMGSAEFEWGAIPKSLGRIRETINEYTYLDVPMRDKVITVFCKDSQKSEMRKTLEELAENKIRLKEHSNFHTYINPMDKEDQERFGGHDTDFWWDIENDFMFFKKDVEFEIEFKKIIATKPI
jgi:hypothetical protein